MICDTRNRGRRWNTNPKRQEVRLHANVVLVAARRFTDEMFSGDHHILQNRSAIMLKQCLFALGTTLLYDKPGLADIGCVVKLGVQPPWELGVSTKDPRLSCTVARAGFGGHQVAAAKQSRLSVSRLACPTSLQQRLFICALQTKHLYLVGHGMPLKFCFGW